MEQTTSDKPHVLRTVLIVGIVLALIPFIARLLNIQPLTDIFGDTSRISSPLLALGILSGLCVGYYFLRAANVKFGYLLAAVFAFVMIPLTFALYLASSVVTGS